MSRFEVLGPDHESLPVPVFGAEGLRIARMLAPTRVDPDTQRRLLLPPSYVVEQRADTGAFAEARAVSPRNFGLDHDPTVALGELVRTGDLGHGARSQGPQPHRSESDFEDAARRLHALLDAVLPVFAAGPGARSGDVSAEARDARQAFFALAEAPLLPYYRSLGQAFFGFLDRAAGPR